MKDEIIICDCGSAEHQVVLRYDDDKDLGRMVYVEIHLVPLVWYKRLWHGIKYIFGYKCCYGNFEEMILSPKHARQIYGLYRFLNKPNLEYVVEASDALKVTVGDKPCGITTIKEKHRSFTEAPCKASCQTKEG